MGIQKKIASITKQGYYLDILIDEQGGIVAGIFTKPCENTGLSESVLEPANETGNDLDDVLNNLLTRLNKQMFEESKS